MATTATSIGKVKFEKVYPIYGAIDVKGSTELRNDIYRNDNIAKVTLLDKFLERLSSQKRNKKINQLAKKSTTIRHWLEGPAYERYLLDTYVFLNEELHVHLEELKSDNNELTDEIDNFLAIVKKLQGKHSDRFELSLQQLNRLIKEEVQFFNATVQEIFPSYFELFRSDGIEYDMYVGQSITPTQKYNTSFLHEIRKQQIISMARIARRAAREAETLPIHMQVTLLMFVHGSPIDISFREDERRFDVEGGYNIRYQMVKKRIDKARIKTSGERLVSPNTIAIVFQGSVLEEEITKLLSQVAAEGYVKTDFSFSTLEEIKGVSDLRAVRAEVLLDQIETLT
ncbi:hypothetical protein [Sphingobacterium sp. JB170]|uniref:hypothetical protein n=1 Tax=Sphingobacterium sp. JB170 TaxID=1434842 RepID=UPI001179C502|nr:hypothetical protein [Sphingobacterium sp. JB170]